ncbi:RidA family protein [Streptomyces violaceusniger]|uniref:RidA family protein n=1 Tax=Streptomyces violaceusniger TaxID=68280 RepID=UPI000995F3AE|nr:RidA family protein [Streptomyces hygroscopicus]AQW48385.1 endoribonuclease [Streptomyces hygroscopicus]
MIRRWNPVGVGSPIGQYSHLASAPADREILMVSGQVGALPDSALSDADADAETQQAFTNLERLLASVGAGPEHVMKLFTMVAGTHHGVRAARQKVFEKWYPEGDWPAQSLIVVTALATPDLAVEVEAVAAVPTR